MRAKDCSEIEDGRYEATFSVKSEMLDVEGKVNERVDGSDSPGKDVNRTLILDEAIVNGLWEFNRKMLILGCKNNAAEVVEKMLR